MAVEDAGVARSEVEVVATDGRVIGRRATLTRRRILDTTADLLRRHGALEVRVIDVAREVGTSPATFYQYFADVEDAIFCLATELLEQVPALSGQIDATWLQPDGLDRARHLVADYVAFWDANGAVLRIMHLRADERDRRFRAVRNDYNNRFMATMVSLVGEAQAAGRVAPDMDPDAAAGAMLAVLDRLSSYREAFERRGTSRQAMNEAVARILHTTLTGSTT